MSTRPQHLYEFGPYRLDTAERLLLRNEEPVPLTPKAFDTLLALVERSGHLVEKDELMKVVWSDAFVEESNLTNNVYALRKMLGEGENGKSYIETVPKRGYRFTAAVKELPSETVLVEKRTLTRVVTEETISDDSLQKPMVRSDLPLVIEHGHVHSEKRSKWRWPLVALLGSSLLIAGIFIYRWLSASRALTAAHRSQIESIAVLPFKNESGNPDIDYLSDGMTESLINSMSQLPQLSVKPRSTVFRYKDQPADLQRIASELEVQGIVEGRLVQRGEALTLYLALVDGSSGNQIWGEQYNRKVHDLVTLQSEIARDVSRKLQERLSGVEERRLAKNYTENTEAYQLYLRGRFHVLKLTRAEVQTGISYYEQAIAVDQNYALAYVGLAEAYRALTLNGEMPPTEFLPQAKAAALRAIQIDDELAQAHSQLGFIVFYYDRDWKEAEKQYQRALELNPNDPDTHQFYANLFSVTGRHAEALAEAKRATELDPLNVRISAIEAQLLIYAGRPDEALSKLQKTFELDPHFFFAHMFAASAYIDKGMYPEAIAEARTARESSGFSTYPTAFLGYALAKSGRQAEARAVLADLLKTSSERYVHPYNVAMIYNGLGDRDETIAWLERGYQQREPRMVFLKVEKKWNNLRNDPRFQDLLRRLGLEQ